MVTAAGLVQPCGHGFCYRAVGVVIFDIAHKRQRCQLALFPEVYEGKRLIKSFASDLDIVQRTRTGKLFFLVRLGRLFT